MTDILLVLFAVILIVLLAILLWMVAGMAKNSMDANRQIYAKSQESLHALKAGDQKIAQDFQNILAQLSSLSSHQAYEAKSLDWMQDQVDAMSRIMMNNKQRGSWGEYQLENLLALYAGENRKVFEMQYQLENGKIADAVFHIPGSGKVLCIDSKFPGKDYIKICEEPENEAIHARNLAQAMKKHIDDIANKYITTQTSASAVLFLPSDAIYQYVCASLDQVLSYALSRHVLITSPTTLAGVVFTLAASSRDFYRAKNLRQIEKKLYALQEDIDRLEARLDKAGKSLDAASNALALARTSALQVSSRYERLLSGSGKETNDFSNEG